jgi:hypothetical protein
LGRRNPQCHQRATAITTGAAEHYDPLSHRVAFQKTLAREMSEIPARILYHLDQFDLQVLHHRTIHLDHLVGSEVRNI